MNNQFTFFKKHYFVGWIGFLISVVVLPIFIFINIKSKVIASKDMSQSEMIGHLMNEISTLDSRFSSEISWILTIISLIGIIVGFYSYQQWKLSSDSITKIENQINNDFELDKIHNLLNDTIKKAKKQDNLQETYEEKIDDISNLLIKTRKESNESKSINFAINLDIISTMFENIDKSYLPYKVRNMTLKLKRLFQKNEGVDTDNFTICDGLVGINTGLLEIKNINFNDEQYNDVKSFLEYTVTSVISTVNLNSINNDDKDKLTNFISTINDITGKNFMPNKLNK